MDELGRDSGAKKAAEELWLKVLSDFDNETMHQKFIDYCTATQQLPFAGEKYKVYREEKGNSPLVEKCMKKIVISAQYQYLPDKEGGGALQKGRSSRLLTSLMLMIIGFISILLWISLPALRIFLLIILAFFLGYVIYGAKGKV